MANWWDMYHLNPETLPNYIPGVIYDKAGNPLYTSNAPYGGPTTGGPGVGYSAVGAPNSGGGAGFVGSGYGYTPAGPPVASIGGFGDRGRGINADASAYLGGDFQGGGSGDFAFGGGGGGGGGVEFGGNLADWSQNPYSPMDPNATMFDGGGSYWDEYGGGIYGQNRDWAASPYDGYGSTWGGSQGGGGIGSDAGATGGRYNAYDWMNQPIQTPATPTYSGGGIGSDAARTGDRQWGDPSWWSGGGIGSDAGATGGRYDPSTGYYTGGGIGSDAGATGGRYDFGDYALTPSELRDALAMRLGQQAEILGTSGGESSYPYQPPPNTKMGIGPENLPPTPFGGGFNMRPPTYNNRNEFNQPGTGQIAPPGDQPWAFPGYTPPSSSVPGMDPSWPGYGPGMQPNWGGWDNFNAPPSPGGA